MSALGHVATAFSTWELKEQIYEKLILFILGQN